MVTVGQEERAGLDTFVVGVVVDELGEGQPRGPVGLVIAGEAANVLDEGLASPFSLPVGLRMITGGEVCRDLEACHEILPEPGNELRASVGDDLGW